MIRQKVVMILLSTMSSFLMLCELNAQLLNATGEEELFVRQEEKKGSISLNFDFMLTQTNQYYSKLLYSTVDNELLQGGPALRAEYKFRPNLTLRATLPYLFKLGLFDKANLPGAGEFELNNGLADFSANMTWEIFREKKAPLTLAVMGGLLLPTGGSDDYILPLGNGSTAPS